MLGEFEHLQQKLVPLWASLSSLTTDEQTIVVVPSHSMHIPEPLVPAIPVYEERMLFMLFLLRQPRARMVFVTSQPVDPLIVDYYLSLLPGVIPSHARARLAFVDADDRSSTSLSEKMLVRPDLIERVRSMVPDVERAHIVPYITTELERDLALRLGIPIYGADPRLSHLGTKSGARKLFAESGVPHAEGVEDVRDIDEVVGAVDELRARGAEQVVVKLNDGIGGLSNALVDLRRPVGTVSAVHSMDVPHGSFDDFAKALRATGGVVERLLTGTEVRSPSVQMRVTPLGELEVLSTHDQLLDGQFYEGCRFPADPAYARAITTQAITIGERMVKEGVLGRFAVDFVVVSDGDRWDPYAIEINLRKGGTTHPFLTLQFLTNGRYDADQGAFITPDGARKSFIATDHLEHASLRNLTVETLFDAVVTSGLHFDSARQTGVVLHSMSLISEFGRTGLTAVGDSPEHAEELFSRAREVLARAGGSRARRPRA